MSITSYVSAESAPYWEGFNQQQLRIPYCLDCGHPHLPPGPVCPHCLSDRLEWRAASGRGTIATWVVVQRKYFADFDPPYVVVQVQLDEGPRVTGNAPIDELDRLQVGVVVQARYETAPNGLVLPVFRVSADR